MNCYIATFYSHFGAIRFSRELKKQNLEGHIQPVPRDLSSSCGTCVSYEAEAAFMSSAACELEKTVIVKPDGYECIYTAENS